MKGLVAIIMTLTAITAQAENLQTLSGSPGTARADLVLDDGTFSVTTSAVYTSLPATYEVKNGQIVPSSICKDSGLDWEHCSTILLISFAEDCIEQDIKSYCDQFKKLHNAVGIRRALTNSRQ